jgi:hypothetical protein
MLHNVIPFVCCALIELTKESAFRQLGQQVLSKLDRFNITHVRVEHKLMLIDHSTDNAVHIANAERSFARLVILSKHYFTNEEVVESKFEIDSR